MQQGLELTHVHTSMASRQTGTHVHDVSHAEHVVVDVWTELTKSTILRTQVELLVHHLTVSCEAFSNEEE